MKSLKTQKRIASTLLKSGRRRVRIKPESQGEVKSAITREDVRGLIVKGVISKARVKGVSRGRARAANSQKRKGRGKGPGTRKGGKKARTPKKITWVNKVRAQRSFAKELKGKGLISSANFRKVYLMIKGGFFRSRSHVKLYVNEHGMIKKK